MPSVHPFIFVNGEVLPREEARISPLDAGFLRGDGLFETMRVYNGRVLDLDRHLARLARSAKVFRLDLPPTTEIAEGLSRLIRCNGCASGACRLTLTRGERQGAPGLPHGTTTTLAAHTAPLPPHATDPALLALVTSTLRLDPASPLAGHKTTSYLPFLWARQEAAERGAGEAVLLNRTGEVAECSAANLFAVRGGVVVTPPLEAGCLPGIVRAVVLAICRDLPCPAHQRRLTLDDLYQADEVFITSSLRELSPVGRIDGRPTPTAPGPVTQRLREAYRQRALRQTEGNQ